MNYNYKILKYPRTPHIEGSRLQPGDEDLSQLPFSVIRGKRIIVEEKCDGANSALSFDADGQLLLQSRGRYLTGGPREKHYNLLKQWGNIHRDEFFAVLGCRYIMYGEWMYAKHTVYYDALPHYFLEFDIFDRENEVFLDTPSRKELIKSLPVVSVPVLADKAFSSHEELLRLLVKSNYITDNRRENLTNEGNKLGLDIARLLAETDPSDTMEGLYIKLEEDGIVKERMKYVRASFAQAVETSDSFWLSRPIIQNGLAVPLDSLLTRSY